MGHREVILHYVDIMAIFILSIEILKGSADNVSQEQSNPFVDDITNSFRSKAMLLLVNTGEWQRVQGGLLDAIDRESEIDGVTPRHFLRFGFVSRLQMWMNDGNQKGYWSSDEDMVNSHSEDSPDELINWLRDDFDEPVILWLDDFHPNVDSERDLYPAMMYVLRHFVRLFSDGTAGIGDRKTIVITGENVPLMEELIHEASRVELPLPNTTTLFRALDHIKSEYNISTGDVDDSEDFLSAALGLSVQQAMSAFRQAFIVHGRLAGEEARREIQRHKQRIIAQSGCLEYIEPDVDIDDVGGLEVLKEWLEVRRKAYSPEAMKRGLPMPKGLLLTGVPGCGKSLTAKAVAANWGYPLIRFDIGAAFAGVVGASETNIRQALRIAEAASPCVLWVDEIEKGLAGSGGSGDLDSGVTQRVFGTILTWLNEVKKPVFVVATANNLSNLPPELKRKGRFDEIFFVDLPDESSREEILKIHINRREPEVLSEVDMEELVKASHGFTGAELETVVNDAQFAAFNDDNRPMVPSDLLIEIKRLSPMSEAMKEDIDEMRIEANRIGQSASRGTGAGKPPRKSTGGGGSFRGT